MQSIIDIESLNWWFWFINLVFFSAALGTYMVTFLGKCSIALIMKNMPWNRGREVRLE